uniref:Microtubule-associated protein 1 light chain 3 gamma, like n=1 Tax=Scleropages formosus TaxID=113540 RepID=A0A8C9RAM9_SCLFO
MTAGHTIATAFLRNKAVVLKEHGPFFPRESLCVCVFFDKVIVERCVREKHLPLLDKSKFLVPFELTMGQFLSLLRSKIDLSPTQTLYLLVSERSMSCMSASMGEIYSQHSDPDGFLYMTYASQDVFGGIAVWSAPPF